METKTYLQRQFKSTFLAYVLMFVCFGHLAYMGKWGRQFLAWGISSLILVLPFGVALNLDHIFPGPVLSIAFITPMIVMPIWFLIDLFTLHGRVDRYNRQLAFKIESI